MQQEHACCPSPGSCCAERHGGTVRPGRQDAAPSHGRAPLQGPVLISGPAARFSQLCWVLAKGYSAKDPSPRHGVERSQTASKPSSPSAGPLF